MFTAVSVPSLQVVDQRYHGAQSPTTALSVTLITTRLETGCQARPRFRRSAGESYVRFKTRARSPI